MGATQSDAAPAHAAEGSQRATESRSCHQCHRRKVRCDKGQPCSRCFRTGKQCTYPPTGQRIQRPRKKTVGGLVFRLEPLQAPVKHLPTPSTSSSTPGAEVSSSALPSGRPTTAAPAGGETEQFFGDEVLVQKGSQSQYFNEPLHSRMMEDQKDIQSVLATPPSTDPEPPQCSIYNPMGILSPPSRSRPSYSYFPPKHTALRLWHIYLERIDACSGIKVLHVPTDEVRVCAAIENPAAASPENLALCYAVFYAAVAVLPPTEAQTLSQQDPDPLPTVQKASKAGFERALAEAEILDKPTLPLLSAMALYLSAMQLHSQGKGIWVLNGLAIRLAQGMGLHRDGERLGLSPFQSELRRRVWWHILGRDGRAAEDSGLQKFCTMRSDARLPLHVDDADLDPGMVSLPPPRMGVFTAMTLPLAGYEITRAVRRLASIAAMATPASPPEEAVRVEIVERTRLRVEELLAGCNPVIPRHRLALLTSRLAMRKADLVSRQQWRALACRNPNSGGGAGSRGMPFATDEDLAEALDVLELALQIGSDEMLKPYSWLWRMNPDYHVVMYLLWHLCVQPDGPNVARAWKAVDRWFSENQDIGEGLGNKGAVVTALRRKAELMRHAQGEVVEGRRGTGGVEGVGTRRKSGAIPVERSEQPQEMIEPSWEGLGGISVGNEGQWTGNLDQLPDWGSFVQAFQLDGLDSSGMAWY